MLNDVWFGDLVKALHWDGQGLCLYAKRLELPKARFVWPQAGSGTVALTAAQVSMLTEGIDWRMPAWTASARGRCIAPQRHSAGFMVVQAPSIG